MDSGKDPPICPKNGEEKEYRCPLYTTAGNHEFKA